MQEITKNMKVVEWMMRKKLNSEQGWAAAQKFQFSISDIYLDSMFLINCFDILEHL